MDGSFRTSALRIENPLSSGASYIFGERVILKQVTPMRLRARREPDRITERKRLFAVR
jgi:hypothetical protein